MKDKIIMLKTCGGLVYGADNKKNIFLMGNKDNIPDITDLKKIIIKDMDWSHDFCFMDDVFYYIKDRKIFNEKGEIKLDMDYPIKIKSKNGKFYILDQEQSSVFIYDKNFNPIKTIGKLGIDKLEKQYEVFFHFPVDFDVFEDYIGVIDSGNRRIVILKGEEKSVFPIIGKKLLFYDKNTVLVLYGEIIYKIDLKNNKILKTDYIGIIDFCIEPEIKSLIVAKE